MYPGENVMSEQDSRGVDNSDLTELGVAARPKEETPLRKSRSIPKDSRCSKNAVVHFQSFAENASIDGIKFLGESGRTVPERIFWAFILITALILCMYLVVQTFYKWISTPVLVSFAASQTPIFEIPFPAVTICPQIKASKAVVNYTDLYLKAENNRTLTEEEKEKFNLISLVCDSENTELLDKNFTINNKAAIDFLMEVAPNLQEAVIAVQWKDEFGAFTNVSNLLSPIITSEGICYTFNGLNRQELFTDVVSYQENLFTTNGMHSDWSPDKGYAVHAGVHAYPRRTLRAGATGGLSILLLALRRDFDYSCGDAFQGFKATLHHPAEIPRVKQNYFRIPLDQNVVASIKPEVMTTTDELRSYTVQDRKCYFASDKFLKFFKVYNQQNCLVECLTNYTLKRCGCVSFHFPKEEATPICNAAKQDCVEEANTHFLVQSMSSSNLEKSDVNKCNCLPACNSVDYEVETSQSYWHWKEYIKILQKTNKWNKNWQELMDKDSINFSQLTVFFKNMQFLSSKRDELYSYTDFWANIGGVIGLFTGFSFITMFEIIYYLSLRPFCNIKLFGRRYWSGAPKELGETLIKTRRNS